MHKTVSAKELDQRDLRASHYFGVSRYNPSRSITVRIDGDAAAYIRRLAEEKGVSVKYMVEQIISDQERLARDEQK